MRVTEHVLSDGREIVYYDPDGAEPRAAGDTRGLPPGEVAQGVMRRDPLTGDWVAIASHRQSRIFLPAASDCPLCPTRDGLLSEIPESSYNVVVFENRFPSFVATGPGPLGWPTDLGTELPSHGRCEVVAFSDDHQGSIADLTPDQMELVVRAWMDRTERLSAMDGIRYVFVFENRGAEVGVTLHHPHGQVYAYPVLPPTARALLEESAGHFARTGRVLLDDVVEFELADGRRIVHRDEHWVAFVPFAARWPFEVQIHPVRSRGALTDLTDGEIASFAHLFPRVVRALDAIFEAPLPYMGGWLQRPAHASAEEARDSRCFLRLISNRRAADKLKFLASSESLMGAFINDISPEDSAATIRARLEASP